MKNNEYIIDEDWSLDKETLRMVNRGFACSPFNNINESVSFISCVGENGNYGQDTIYDGFKIATEIMFEKLKQDEGLSDPLVYPILYCFRHCIELFLKDTYDKIFHLKAIKENRNIYEQIIKLTKKICEYDNNLSEYHCNEKMVEEYNDIDDMKRENAKLLMYIKNGMEKNTTHDLSMLCEKIKGIYSVDKRIPKKFDYIFDKLKYYVDIDP